MVLKPSEKTPLSALAASPTCSTRPACRREMLSVVTGDPREIADALLTNPHVELVTFTGGVAIGKYIAAKVGYRRAVLELGGNDPLIVMDDADLDEALDAGGAGLLQELGPALHGGQAHDRARGGRRAFAELLVEKTKALDATATRPIATVDMGTVIDEAAARLFEARGRRGGGAGRAAAGRQPARGRALLADRARPRAPGDDGGARGDLRPGLAGHPLQGHRRGDPHLERHRLRPVVGGLHQPPRLHHALRRASCTSARSTCARCPATASR